MFEFDEEAQRYVAAHHPFTSPKDGHEDYLSTDPAQALAKAYDLVLNGWEIGGGSIRIHREDVQSKVFRALKISAEEAGAKFGFLLDALQYGAPPHGGVAFGLDRLVAMMAGAESIRDVIAFPKTQRAQDLLTQAPSEVDEKQLRELHIRVRSEAKAVEPRVAFEARTAHSDENSGVGAGGHLHAGTRCADHRACRSSRVLAVGHRQQGNAR